MKSTNQDGYLVMYIKLSNIRRKSGVEFKGPFVGGTTADRKGAEAIVRRIISEQRGFAIIPKIFQVEGEFERVKLEAIKEFNKMKAEIRDADTINHRK